MATHTKRVAKKQTPPGFLQSAAEAIGSTLGSLAVKTGLVSPAEPATNETSPAHPEVKKTSVRNVKKTSARTAASRTVKAAPAKVAPTKAAKRIRRSA